MRFSEITKDKQFIINAYDVGKLTVNGINYSRHLIVSPERVIDDGLPESLIALNKNHIEQLAELAPEILIIGTGKQQLWPEGSILKQLINKKLNFEIMHTPAACRTYNLLLSEDRRVIAALFMI